MKRCACLAIALLLAGCGDPAPPQEPQEQAAALAFSDLNGNGAMEPYEDAALPVDTRVDDLIARMSLEQKAHYVSGTGLPPEIDRVPGAAGYTMELPELGIPAIVLADGPAGLRILPHREGEERSFFATAFPVATALSSTWDTELAQAVGAAMGVEVREYGVDILLAPGINIHRDPRGGRNFEYFSEDPYLNGHIAAAMVGGVQSAGVGATPKHFVANNQETNRYVIDTIVGERTLREIYLRGFEIVVRKANPWAIMSAYNQVNGAPASQSHSLLTAVLRDEWGFDGLVMTDWWAGQDDTVAQMRAGNDLLMPGTEGGTKQILRALESGELNESVLDLNLKRILGVVFRTPSFQGYEPSNAPDLEEHAAIARSAAADGVVLLKNDNEALPMRSNVRKIAAFGNASYDFISGGTGSGDVNEAYTVSLVQALVGRGYEMDEALQSAYVKHIEDEKAKQPPREHFWEFRPPPPEMPLDGESIASLSVSADLALITLGRNSGEFQDRPLEGDFYLTPTELQLIESVSAAFHAQGKKVVVILNIGNVIETASWRDAPDAIVVPWQGGQEAGNAVLDVLVGDVNPSGRLPTTFPVRYQDVPTANNFPGEALSDEDILVSGIFRVRESRVEYQEGIFLGYRHYDRLELEPAYPFGFGLSYTGFDYGDVALDGASSAGETTLRLSVTNSGERAGREVVQLYLAAPAGDLAKPPRELKGFAKTRLLQPNETQTLAFTLSAADLASYSEDRSAWIADVGAYVVGLGPSSRDIRAQAEFKLESELVTQESIAEL